MTARKYVTLWCDHEDCLVWFSLGEYHRVDDARREAKRAGWTNRSSIDLCPKHSPGGDK